MQVVGYVLFGLLACFVLWFAIDTIVVVVKKVKAKKEKKKQDSNSDVENH